VLAVSQVEDQTDIKRLVRSSTGPGLRVPLGTWNEDYKPQWEVCWGTGRLFDTVNKLKYDLVSRRSTRNSEGIFDGPTTFTDLPEYTQPARTRQQDNCIIVTGWGTRRTAQRQDTSQTLQDHLTRTKTKEKWLWQNLQCTDEGEKVLGAIADGTALAVSDGTLKNGQGAAKAVIEGPDKAGRIRLDSLTSGANAQQSSFQSEPIGLLTIVSFIHGICSWKGITMGSICVACDGAAAVNEARRYKEQVNPRGKQVDIIAAIRGFVHVKGHTKVRPFTRATDLNEEMDEECKDFLDERDPIKHEDAPLSKEPLSIWIDGVKAVSAFHETITLHLQNQRSRHYWADKAGIRQSEIDWGILAKATKTATRSRQVWLTKLASNFCACGKMMVRMGKWENDTCPRCPGSEDAEHIWTCGATMTASVWEKGIEDLRAVVNQHEAPEPLTEAMIEAIKWWRPGEPAEATSNDEEINEVLQKQGKLSWRALCEGRWTTAWQEAYSKQRRQYKCCGKRGGGFGNNAITKYTKKNPT
jgi:hypothetical protein